jgi:hypothetical protein
VTALGKGVVKIFPKEILPTKKDEPDEADSPLVMHRVAYKH